MNLPAEVVDVLRWADQVVYLHTQLIMRQESVPEALSIEIVWGLNEAIDALYESLSEEEGDALFEVLPRIGEPYKRAMKQLQEKHKTLTSS